MEKIIGILLAIFGALGIGFSLVGLSYWWVIGIVAMGVAAIGGAGIFTVLVTGVGWAVGSILLGFIGLGLSALIGAIGVALAE